MRRTVRTFIHQVDRKVRQDDRKGRVGRRAQADRKTAGLPVTPRRAAGTVRRRPHGHHPHDRPRHGRPPRARRPYGRRPEPAEYTGRGTR